MSDTIPAVDAAPSAPARPRLREVLRRGVRGTCPRCGEGPLFRRGIQAHERCSACNLQFQRNYGDTWMFIILLDRVPILFGIVAVYFGFRATDWMLATAFFLALAIPMIATVRHRQGLALALDYLSRVYMPDPSDEIHGGRAIAR
ncbi:MAG: hypothetical protein QOH21_2945 [Acidobacteriota bacterium]|jgi:uncharacterized protein (DUF983 family)|nr:hypothetical protein [Acidobacteriota bacterium]